MAQQELIRQFRNTFEGGLDTDTVSSFLKPNTYKDAQNISMVTNGKFFSLTNVLGTTDLIALNGITSPCIVIGVFNNTYQIGTTLNLKCLTIFGYDNSHFKIWCYDTTNNAIYQIYQETVNPLFLTAPDKVIDAVAFGEFGFDDLYFTDNVNEPRKIECIIPVSYTPNFLLQTQIGLPQRKAIGQISGVPTSGGSLLTGTYQLAYQLVSPSINKYTRFSLLTNPIHIYTSDTQPKAGIGLPSSSKIVAGITFTDDEYANFTHFRIAIVSNIYAEGTTVETLNTVGLTKMELISDYFTSGTSIGNYNILNNAQINTTTIDEIVTDLIALDYVKTLNIKRNRLILGNINVKSTLYNNGTPSITGGSILQYSNATTSIKDTFTIQADSSTKRGHFRNEVYRYAISYFDKWGNFSFPKTLDLSSVQDNQISTGIDMKFPDRSFTASGRYYTVLNASDQCISLGLQLTGITNHPTWAVGFVILRAKRKKNILFQTPLIPLSKVYGLGALQNYPAITFEPPIGSPTSTAHPSATPMGPGAVLMPPNMAFGALVENGTQPYVVQASSGATTTYIGEPSHLYFPVKFTHGLVFPPDSMYTKLSPFVFSGNETFLSIDTMLNKCYYTPFGGLPAGAVYNVYADDNCSMSFFTVSNNEFFNSFGAVNGSQRPGTFVITGNKFFDNLSVGTSLNGFNIFDSTKLTTPTIQFGHAFNNQRGVVIEVNYNNNTGGIPVLNNPPSGSFSFPAGTVSFTPSNSGDNYSITKVEYGQSSAGVITVDPYGNARTFANSFEIINVQSGLQDNRYGSADTQNEFFLTGTQVNFTTAEQAIIAGGGSVVPKTVNIWGGDCFVSYHTFKLSETAWTISNYGKVANPTFNGTGADLPETGAVSITRYGRVYIGNSSDNSPLHIPLFFKNHSQYITLPLESEYIGSVRDVDTPEVVTTQNNIPIYGAATEYKNRAPMGYNYNINLTKQNDQKLFIPVDKNIPIVTQYKARVLYSDEKIYQSLINGFDTFRQNNFFDYEERYGGLTKLALGGDNLYGIQQKAMFYIPINERVMETTDASQLAVRTSDFISEPLYLSTNKGCQHIQSVIQQGQFVICADQLNRQVYRIEGQQFEIISDKGMVSQMQAILTPDINENKLTSFYDILKDEYWLIHKDGTFCYIWNNDYKVWTSNITFPHFFGASDPSTIGGGIYQNNALYLINQNGGNPRITTMYTGLPGELFGSFQVSSVTFVINPDLEFSKIFDNLLINANGNLGQLDLNTDQLFGTTQVMSSLDLTTASTRGKEGGFMIKTLRDSSKSRIRGLYSTAKIEWIIDNTLLPQVGMSSVVSNSRLSSKTF